MSSSNPNDTSDYPYSQSFLFMYSWIEYNRTGIWPANVPSNVSNEQVNSKFKESAGHNIEDSQITKKFISDDNNLYDLINSSIDSFFKEILSFFKPEFVSGYFDDLYGFIWFTQILLFIISISLLFLFIIYIFINIFLLNKDNLNKYLNGRNKLLKFYFKYQTIIG